MLFKVALERGFGAYGNGNRSVGHSSSHGWESDTRITPMDPVKRGFASLSPERQREIAREGGRAVPPQKRSFSTNRELAKIAGQKGGQSVAAAKRTFSRDPLCASNAGKKGRATRPAKQWYPRVNGSLACSRPQIKIPDLSSLCARKVLKISIRDCATNSPFTL